MNKTTFIKDMLAQIERRDQEIVLLMEKVDKLEEQVSREVSPSCITKRLCLSAQCSDV